jgi:hypothetical protein
MRSHSTRFLAALVIAGLGVLPGAARADDQGVVGLKLILIDKYNVGKAKAVFVAKDTTAGAIHNGSGSGNPADVSGTVRICPTAAPGNVARYALPSPWLVNKPGISKYVNKTAAPGTGGAKVVVVKPGFVLKVVAKNLGDDDAASGNDSATDLDLNDPPGTCTVSVGDTLAVEVEVVDAAGPGTHRMCSQFTVDSTTSIGGGTGCKVVSKTSTAGPCGVCGGGGSTTTTTVSSSTTTTSPSGALLQGALTETPGRFNYNLQIGLPAANSACNTNFPGTHACTYAELQTAESMGELVGLKDTANNPVMSFWAIDSSQPPLQQCQDDVVSFQNWEYATAHTGSRGQKVALDNGTGALGPLQPSLQCNFSTAWVGCCQ